MLRARAPVGQGLGGPWLLDGHEAFPLQALEHRERRRQQFTLLAVVPTPTCDRRLDGGDQELGRRPSVTRFHRRAPGEPDIQKSPEPSAPTRSPTTDSIRAKLIPGDSDDFRRSYSCWLSPTPRGRPLRIQIKPRRMPEASVLPPTSLSQAAGGGTSGTSGVSSMLRFGRQREPAAINANGTPGSVQPIAFASSLTVRRYFRISSARACRVASGISGIELCDDHHTLPPFFFIALPTHDVPPDKIKTPPQGRLSECYTGYSSSSPRGSSRLLPGQLFSETRNHGRWRAATG